MDGDTDEGEDVDEDAIETLTRAGIMIRIRSRIMTRC